ncbi:MAG: helix-turn-helix domain-containing protein [Desulfurobacteriaceae bacterium]
MSLENPARARELVRKVLEQNKENVSKTAKVLNIDRKTVRRARDGTLEDLPGNPRKSGIK